MHEFCKVVKFDDDFSGCPNVNPVSTNKIVILALICDFTVTEQIAAPLQKVINLVFGDLLLVGLGPTASKPLKKSEFSNFFLTSYFNNMASLKNVYSSNQDEHNAFVVFGLTDINFNKTANFNYFNITSPSWVKNLKEYIDGI
jgi:hypothetical protein